MDDGTTYMSDIKNTKITKSYKLHKIVGSHDGQHPEESRLIEERTLKVFISYCWLPFYIY